MSNLKIEQFILMIFIPIGLLISGIYACEKNFLLGIENYLTNFSKKYNVNINNFIYRGLYLFDILMFVNIKQTYC